jgi:EAL domain-containing protein (putative c-di-GMP-specific phosphodiesterase class I)
MVGQTGEIIGPGVFLPVAEKCGLIGEIDKWVITQAATLAAAGRHVCANLSADSIGNLDLLGWIERQLSRANANPANVVFEITETALMGNLENQHLVKATVNIAQGFGLQTIAEGVDDSETLELLRDYGSISPKAVTSADRPRSTALQRRQELRPQHPARCER